jgi:phenylalanyl-tRNA synthetase beta chain
MRVPLSWVREFVDVELSPAELARKLTFAGLEVEGIEFVGLPLPAGDERPECKVSGFGWDPDLVVVGDLLEVEPHPNADRLVLAKVDHGAGIEWTVTGAPNLAAFKGRGPLAPPLKVAVAREGAVLLDSGQKEPTPRRLTRAKIRGVESRAMVCSEKELGISDRHEGVVIFDSDAPPPGTPLADYAGDYVLDIDITPNMVRNASILGVAREIAALTGAELRPPSTAVEAEGPPLAGRLEIDIRDPELNPRFTALLLEGARIAASPYWLQQRLLLAGQRPISNVVDITNYVMLEIGQPLHAFDYDVLVERAGRSGAAVPKIITRRPEPGEKLKTLDDVDRELDDFTVLVADTAGALSLGGVMGGQASEVSDATTSVLLEAAAWDLYNIRRTTLSQQLSSEAGYRFSRGVHPALASLANLRAIELMRRLAGGRVAEGMLDLHPRPFPETVVELPMAEIARALGVEIEAAEVIRILEALEFGVESDGDLLEVTAPHSRLDIGEGSVGIADLIEEIARIWGYERIPETQISDTIPPQRANPEVELEERARDLLARLGLQEIVTYRLTTPEREARARRPGAAADERRYVELRNPISADRGVMRHELLPGVLEVAAGNSRQRDSLGLFEIGPVFLPVEGETLPREPRRLAIVLAGAREASSWDRQQPPAYDLFDLKGVVEAFANDLQLPPLTVSAGEHPTFHPGRSALLELSGTPIGALGELDPTVRAGYEFPFAAVLAVELDLERLVAAIPQRFAALAVSAFPPVVEDLAFDVGDGVAAASVEAIVVAAGGDLLRGIELFDLFRGEQLGDGRKSLAYRLTYQAEDRTLTDAEVAEVRRAVVAAVEGATGGRLRE